MLVGTSAGLVRVSPDLCEIETMAAFGGARVSALARGSNAVYAATDAGFFVSSDQAQSFRVEDDSVFDSLELARDGVVYATGRLASTRAHPRVYFARWRSGDALEQHELALQPTEVGIALLGSDPQRVFAVAHAYLGTDALDRFLISSDGARSWTSPFSAPTIGALVIDTTRDTWLAGAQDGLWRGTADQAPQRLQDAAVSCLALATATQPPQLYVCDGIGSEGGLSLSADGGESYRSVFRFNQVAGLGDCPVDSKAVHACQTAWADWTLEMPPGPPLLGIETLAPAIDSSGCAAVSGSRNTQTFLWLLLAAAFRRRRHSQQTKQT